MTHKGPKLQTIDVIKLDQIREWFKYQMKGLRINFQTQVVSHEMVAKKLTYGRKTKTTTQTLIGEWRHVEHRMAMKFRVELARVELF